MTDKILFISPNRIGDSVIASGVVRELGRRFPGAPITVVAGGPPAPFFRAAPGVERVVVIDKKRNKGHWLDMWRAVSGTRWRLVVDVRGSAISWLIPTRERRVYSRKLEIGRPKVEMYSDFVGADHVLEPELFIDDRARAEAAAVIDPQMAGPPDGRRAPILALAPIAHQPGKSWPAERWGALVEKLAAEPRFDGWRFMAVGGPGDHAPTAPALKAAGGRGVDFVGRGDILASAAAIRSAALFVGNDSGLMHVAAAAGTPTLGLFGPTEWWLFGPRGPRTRTLAANAEIGRFAPIEDLDVDRVFQAVLDLHDAYADPSLAGRA